MSIRRRMWTKPPAERFAVAFYAEPTSGCWLWEGTLRNGYGTMKIDGKPSYAHRLSWSIHCGPVPDGMEICHRCDVKCCVNPAHLFIGTHMDNMLDAWGKNIVRQPPIHTGEKHHAAKLTEAQVREIRSRRAAGETRTSIAADFQMTPENIGYIANRITWKEVA